MTTPAPAPTPTAPTLAQFELRYLVLAAQREGNRALGRQLADLGLTTSQFEIILVLSRYGPITLKELGELIVCETASPSRIVDTLVRRGYVERSTHASDRRAVALRLTDGGRELVPRLREIEKVMDDGARVMFDGSEMTGLVSALRTYLDGTESGAVLERRFADDRLPLD